MNLKTKKIFTWLVIFQLLTAGNISGLLIKKALAFESETKPKPASKMAVAVLKVGSVSSDNLTISLESQKSTRVGIGCDIDSSVPVNWVQDTVAIGLFSRPAECFSLKSGNISAIGSLKVKPLASFGHKISVLVSPSTVFTDSIIPDNSKPLASFPSIVVVWALLAYAAVIRHSLKIKSGCKPKTFQFTHTLYQLQVMRC